MGNIKKPVVYQLRYDQDNLNRMIFKDEKSKEYILDYPTIYIINDEEEKNLMFMWGRLRISGSELYNI